LLITNEGFIMRRSYTTAIEIVPQLERIIRELRRAGENFLPSERRLQEQVGASRMTLRKSLDVLERRGLLIKGAGGRMIDGIKQVKGCVTMVSAGWDFPGNPVWLRLSIQLEKCLSEHGIEFRQVMFGYDDPEKNWSGKLDEIPEILIFTDAPNDYIREKIMALRNRCTLISTDEDYLGQLDHIVSLNNYQAGKIAAETMLSHGVKNPAFLYWDYGYVPFMKRRNGFSDALKQAGLRPEKHIYPFLHPQHEMRSTAFVQTQLETVHEIYAAGHDGLFVWSDESIRAIYGLLSDKVRIPDDFVLMTLDGCGECRNHSFMIDAISHNTNGIAMELAALAGKILKREPYQKINLIDTEVLQGGTGRW